MNVTLAKKICKKHGLKGFRKIRLKRECYIAGKQTNRINTSTALSLLDDLTNSGFLIRDLPVLKELAENGLLDSVTIG